MTERILTFWLWHQATTKDIKDSLGKQWTQLSDKKRLKWIGKSLELQKQYEVNMLTTSTKRATAVVRIRSGDDKPPCWQVEVNSVSLCNVLGDHAGVHPAAPRVKHDPGGYNEVHPD